MQCVRDVLAVQDGLTHHSLIHEDMKKFFEGYPPNAHPMAILSAMTVALATYFTSSDLAGNVAADYGFNVTDTGIRTKVVNVGDSGAAFDVDTSNRGQPGLYQCFGQRPGTGL